MVVTNEGITRIVNLVSADLDNGQAGTGTTADTPADTGLETAVAATKVALTKEIGDKSISVSHLINSTTATGNSFTEWEVRMNTDTDTLSRSTTAAIAHTVNDEITRITTVFINQK